MTERQYDSDIPKAEDLDWRTVARILTEWREEYSENGDDWSYPGEWWHQRAGKLQIRCETRAQMENLGLVETAGGNADE